MAVSLTGVGLTRPPRSLAASGWLTASRLGKPLRSPNRAPVGELESELARLRAENATLRMEREILKKATAFFAKEST